MDTNEMKPWVEANIDRLLQEYGIPHWEVTIVYYDNPSLEWAGRCTAYTQYEQAVIKLNRKNITDIEKVLRHELSHIIHSPFNIYRCAVREALDSVPYSDPLQRALDEVWSNVIELAVKNIERMHSGLTGFGKDGE